MRGSRRERNRRDEHYSSAIQPRPEDGDAAASSAQPDGNSFWCPWSSGSRSSRPVGLDQANASESYRAERRRSLSHCLQEVRKMGIRANVNGI